MVLIGILVALVLERLLGRYSGWGRPVIFLRIMSLVRSLLPRAIWQSPVLPLLAIALPAAAAHWLCGLFLNPLLNLAASAGVLLLCLGPRDLAEDVRDLLAAREAGDLARAQRIVRNLQRGPQPDQSHRSLMGTLFIQSHEKLFGVLLWYFVAGPAGAVAYRVATRLPRLLAETAAGSSAQFTAEALHGLLAFVPARITAVLYGLAGSLDDALIEYRRLRAEAQHGWRSHTWALLAEIATASLRSEDDAGQAQAPDLNTALQEVLGMQLRALMILLALFAIFATGSMF
ncbi:CobD/Cbib protein [Solimonas aquatica]|uniref:CobD/Cbib protein n=1 Tax=Solimonas aquatica TaxID=489703 RepID=A0A1H9EFQ1_9GAMM|nr:regulatory signaling modulator protein AmpE [Solimonas aquatica]SEQ24501.1 CobD/Cbib protein [Solimonas aquatica]